MRETFIDASDHVRHRIFIGTPEKGTTIEQVPGATLDTVNQAAALLLEAANDLDDSF